MNKKPFSDAQIDAAAKAGRENFWEPTEADVEEALRLIAAGYKQTSAKYRSLARLPEGKNGYEALRDSRPEAAAANYERFLRGCETDYLRFDAQRGEGLHTEVTPGVFRAFKRLGGGIA